MELKKVTLQDLLKAGVHFGHQTRYSNPKMKSYVYGVRNRIHLIDLSQTLTAIERVQNLLVEASERGSRILFVGTKKVSESLIKTYATACGQHYINKRWLGGTLTNWKTVRRSIKSLKDLMKQKSSGFFEFLTKKEELQKENLLKKLEARLGGLIHLNGLPDYLFVVDAQKEKIAIQEANKVGIPTIAILDTNVSDEGIHYAIPGNDDAMSAIKLYLEFAAQAIEVGKWKRQSTLQASVQEASNAEAHPLLSEGA